MLCINTYICYIIIISFVNIKNSKNKESKDKKNSIESKCLFTLHSSKLFLRSELNYKKMFWQDTICTWKN